MNVRWAMHTGVTALAAVLALGIASAGAQTAALSGRVASAEEPAMEGVLVSVKRDGSTITTTVASDASGRYSIPAGRLEPGSYRISIRAVGFTLEGPRKITVTAGQAVSADLKLAKSQNLAAQLSNAEWIMSLPGADKDKVFLNNCVGCHTLQPIMTSTHNAEEFRQIFQRMGIYAPGSTPQQPQVLLPGPRGERPRVNPAMAGTLAEYLASVNLSATTSREYPLKTLPRPKGQGTRAIITEYDLPRATAEPHDVVIDPDGVAWYCDFGAKFIGSVDPKTGKVTEYELPELKRGSPLGSLDLELDPDGNLWVAMMYQAGIAKFDRKTKTVQAFPIPQDWQSGSTQQSMVTPTHSNVDGKVWTNNQDTHAIYRLDLATGKFENLGEMKDASGKYVNGYGIPADKDNNLYLLEFGGARIAKVEARTGKTAVYDTPTPRSRPRRGRVDEQNRLWFGEYGGNAIGMFDPKTETIKEWPLPTAWSLPYDVAIDRKGEVWTGSMLTDQVARLDPGTGKFVEYLLPRSTNIRRMFVDNKGERPVVWIGSNHGASIIRLEPLD